MRIITRYVVTEFLLYFALALAASTSILILRQIFLLTKLFVRKDVSLWYLVELIIYALPAVLALTVPIALLAGMLMVLGQFAFTGEITAIQASGIGIHQLIPPVLVVGLVFALVDFFFIGIAAPWGNREYLNLKASIRQQNPAVVLEEDTVMRDLEQFELIWLYERTDPKTGDLVNIRLWQKYRDGLPRFVLASRGRLGVQDGKGALVLRNGISYEPDTAQPGALTKNRFRTETLYVPLEEDVDRADYQFRTYRAMQPPTLLSEIRSLKTRIAEETSEMTRQHLERLLRRARLEWHKKFSIPFATLVFALVSVPLGIMTKRSGFMVGMVIGLPLIIVYYTLLRVGETLSIHGTIPAGLGPWLPNVPTLLLGIVLTVRMWRR